MSAKIASYWWGRFDTPEAAPRPRWRIRRRRRHVDRPSLLARICRRFAYLNGEG